MKKFLKDIVFSENIDISDFSTFELLRFFDDVQNFYVRDSRLEEENNIIIDNYLVSLTHGEYKIPAGHEHVLIKQSADYIRLLKNFSDFGTSYIADSMKISDNRVIRNDYSRGIGDCNRDIEDTSDTGYLRKTDFNGKKIFSDRSDLLDIAKKNYIAYHANISNMLEGIEKEGKTSFLFDLHDTGVRLMDFDVSNDSIKSDLFPSISIADLDGETSDEGVLEYFAERITKYLGFPVLLNVPYKGGFVTRHHGLDTVKGKNIKRNVIQIELARFLYMTESTQEVDKNRADMIGDGLNRAMRDTVVRFS